MKIALIALVALAAVLASASAVPATRGLKEDFDDFVKLVDLPQLKRVALKYYASDKETKQFVKYLKGETFAAVWDQVFTNEHVLQFLKNLQSQGVDVQSVVNQVAKFLKHPQVDLGFLVRKPGKGLKELVTELVNVLPLADLKALFDEKLQTSEEFKQLFDTVAAFDYDAMKDFVNNSEQFLDLFETLKSYDLDVDAFLHDVEEFFGWN